MRNRRRPKKARMRCRVMRKAISITSRAPGCELAMRSSTVRRGSPIWRSWKPVSAARRARIAAEAKGDITKFDQIAKEFRTKFLQNQDPALRGPVNRAIDSRFSVARNGLINQEYRNEIRAQEGRIEAAITANDNDLTALAHEGGTGHARVQRGTRYRAHALRRACEQPAIRADT